MVSPASTTTKSLVSYCNTTTCTYNAQQIQNSEEKAHRCGQINPQCGQTQHGEQPSPCSPSPPTSCCHSHTSPFNGSTYTAAAYSQTSQQAKQAPNYTTGRPRSRPAPNCLSKNRRLQDKRRPHPTLRTREINTNVSPTKTNTKHRLPPPKQQRCHIPPYTTYVRLFVLPAGSSSASAFHPFRAGLQHEVGEAASCRHIFRRESGSQTTNTTNNTAIPIHQQKLKTSSKPSAVGRSPSPSKKNYYVMIRSLPACRAKYTYARTNLKGPNAKHVARKPNLWHSLQPLSLSLSLYTLRYTTGAREQAQRTTHAHRRKEEAAK